MIWALREVKDSTLELESDSEASASQKEFGSSNSAEIDSWEVGLEPLSCLKESLFLFCKILRKSVLNNIIFNTNLKGNYLPYYN